MSHQKPNYLDAIVYSYPSIVARCHGDANVYENIESENDTTIPSKAELDTVIATILKQQIWVEIQAERTRRQAGGVFIQSANKWFHSDQTSRIQQLGLVMMGSNMPANINWKTLDGSFTIMTPSLALSIFNATANLDMTTFSVAEQHRANMNNSQNPELYDYSGFWPAIYEA